MKPLLPLDRVQNWDQLLVLTPVAASWGGRGHVTILCLSFSHVRQGWELWPFRDDFLRSTIKRALKLHVFITDSWWLALSLWACILPTWRNKEMRLHPWDWPAGCLILYCLVPIRFAYLIFSLRILYMQTEICQSQIAVQGAMDAHWAVGHSLASLARAQSVGCCVCSRFNAQRSSTHRPWMLRFPLKKWGSLLWGVLVSALLDTCDLRGTR